jgi:hypothetical protein
VCREISDFGLECRDLKSLGNTDLSFLNYCNKVYFMQYTSTEVSNKFRMYKQPLDECSSKTFDLKRYSMYKNLKKLFRVEKFKFYEGKKIYNLLKLIIPKYH